MDSPNDKDSLPLDAIAKPLIPSRIAYHHNLIAKGFANDDEIHMNTQSTSQWDSMRHFPYQDGYRYYNGTTMDDIAGSVEKGIKANNRNGIQNIAKKGIATRGVLIDWCSYAKRKGIKFSAFDRYEIPLQDIIDIAKESNIVFRPGDILILRTGLTEQYTKLTYDEKIALTQRGKNSFIGIACGKETAQWFWSQAFAAVATDTLSFEAWPRQNSDSWTWLLHEIFLAGWGMPIGELWDLELLAAKCEEVGRWSFLLTSQPLIIDGGVASPPNAMAIL